MNDFYQRVYNATDMIGEISHEDAIKTLPEIDIPSIHNMYGGYNEKEIKAVVWNLERGSKLPEIIAYLKYHLVLNKANLILTNELDCGMARTNNSDISKIIAEEIKMNYVYGIEYVTVDAGRNGNAQGFHGNTIFSKYEILRAKIVRLPLVFDWFYSAQKRIGTRNAVLAVINLDGKEVGVVCAHLENRTSPEKRVIQLKYLLDQVNEYFGDLPILLGGDLNTNCVDCTLADNLSGIKELASNREKQVYNIENTTSIEPLFSEIVKRGYGYKTCNILQKSTRRKNMEGFPDINMNLDWFFQKGFQCNNPQVIRAIFRMEELPHYPAQHINFEGHEISDHDAVSLDCKLIL